MHDLTCPTHPDYDGIGEPPDPECPECANLADDVSPS